MQEDDGLGGGGDAGRRPRLPAQVGGPGRAREGGARRDPRRDDPRPRRRRAALAAVLSGRGGGRVAFPELTDREREVLDLLARGHDNPTIARRLVLSPKTVRNHVSNVLAKIGAADRTDAVIRARDAGLGQD
ncbi:response regulator transcription factor [Nocardioides daphniae]|uniref:response regulator transcription factor n=1 Tax=Nocardioides daphniae TaxID=402297 RepID=UPI001EE82C46|nr:response regulator transcription factor [Nocardioides daphniae]